MQEHENSRDATLETATQLREQKAKAVALENEIREVKARPGSNIPTQFQNFREALAAHLGLAVRELPVLAELVEVKPEECHWRGAIERAIGPERLRILVPNDRLRRLFPGSTSVTTVSTSDFNAPRNRRLRHGFSTMALPASSISAITHYARTSSICSANAIVIA